MNYTDENWISKSKVGAVGYTLYNDNIEPFDKPSGLLVKCRIDQSFAEKIS